MKLTPLTADDGGEDLADGHEASAESIDAGAPATEDPGDGSGPQPLRLAVVTGLIIVLVLAGLCGWLGYRAEQARDAERYRAMLVQVAKQGAVNLTTIDYENAESDVRRIIDSATGQFRDDFDMRSAAFIDVVKKAKSKSIGTVTEAGLESLNADGGKVLVSVTVKTVSNGKAEPEPRYWRMRMTMARDGQQAKVANVDFVP